MADMIISLLRSTLVDLALTPYSQDDEDRAHAALGLPMYPVGGAGGRGGLPSTVQAAAVAAKAPGWHASPSKHSRLPTARRMHSQDNYPPKHNMCMMGSEFEAALVAGASSGFEWANDGTEEKPKWGWIATTPGAKLQFELSTQLATAAAPAQVRVGGGGGAAWMSGGGGVRTLGAAGG